MLTKKKIQSLLPKDVAAEFEIDQLPKLQSTCFIHKGYRINLKNISVEQVKALVKCGVTIFKAKAVKSTKDAD